VGGGFGEALEREREMGPALGGGDGVDLIDDAPARALEQRLGAAGEHQVERLGGGDEDVRRLAQHLLALLLGGVAGAHSHLELRSDPPQRRAQVAVDVVGERLQRRDVDEPDAPVPAVLGRRLGGELIDPVQERGQRLARSRRSGDEHVLAGGDRRPRLLLRGGRTGERPREPVARALAEHVEGRHQIESTHQQGVWRGIAVSS
jgi:hypothetical protein